MQEDSAMEYLNPVLLLMLLSQVCVGICAWQSPRFLRRMAAHLLTRADVVEVSREEGERRMKRWLNEFGLDADPASTKSRFSRDEVKIS
jgi:phosphoribosylformimino-5-aminoimidazole carboxamide ribonucleotide (ProFAR) isomerase